MDATLIAKKRWRGRPHPHIYICLLNHLPTVKSAKCDLVFGNAEKAIKDERDLLGEAIRHPISPIVLRVRMQR